MSQKQNLEIRLAEESKLVLTLKERERDLQAEHKAELQALRHQQFTSTVEHTETAGELAVLNFLRQLQERGRFLDFAMTDIHRLADAQVGAAARVVQQGVKAVLNDYFELQPVRVEAEGSTVSIPDEEEARRNIRVLQAAELEGSAASGRLVHKGWKAHSVRLPKSLSQGREAASILAPAEIQVH